MCKLRAVIYARHSTDKQNPNSSKDQAAACQTLVHAYDARLVATYADPEISGYRRDRPELTKLLRHIETGGVDVVFCEALDRIARDGEDINWLGKKLQYHRVRLITQTEGEVDEIKLAVAGLLGSMFLSILRQKTIRGMQAAVLAGRFAGGKAYGYRKVTRIDESGRLINGLFEICPEQAEIVRRIYQEFGAGRSAIQIATGLNADGVRGPRGGHWNASTIRGDRKKLVGVLNNPLYQGKLIWGRREWRKNPDSDRRERRYRLRERNEWIEVQIPELRIVEVAHVRAVEEELELRARPQTGARIGEANRPRHLLSGLIRCGKCNANYTIVGKDYYRCAGNRERGTCTNTISIRVANVESTVLEALHTELLTPELANLFNQEFNREIQRLSHSRDERHESARARLKVLNKEIQNLAQNFLSSGLVSPTLTGLLTEREAEKAVLEELLAEQPVAGTMVLPHPVLLQRFEEKVGDLREALNDPGIRSEAAHVLRELIHSVTVHLDDAGKPVLDVESSLATLINFAENENTPRRSFVERRSVAVVAGAGFEPATFRL